MTKATVQIPILYLFHCVCQWNLNSLSTKLIAKAIRMNEQVDPQLTQSLVFDFIHFVGQSEFIRLHKFDIRLERLLSVAYLAGLSLQDESHRIAEEKESVAAFIKQQVPYSQQVMLYSLLHQYRILGTESVARYTD